MAALSDLTEEEKYLLALLLDESGVDLAEFVWQDKTSPDNIFRCYDYQVPWYRAKDKYQVDQAARAIGKSLGIQLRSFAFPFTHPGQEMLITAPEMIHLDPVTQYVEERLMSTRLSREFLKISGKATGFTHRPFRATFRNGATINGRIPQKTGQGVKGQHPLKLEMDEGQDYPDAGWVELTETLKYGDDDATWRIHGVSRGERDRYYKMTQQDSGFKVHRLTAMHRPDWSAGERKAKAEMYGSRDHPDYRRNILGLHGDATSSLFVLTRLMACCDTREDSDYNENLYYHLRISDEMLNDGRTPIDEYLSPPVSHKGYDRVWVGCDLGLTNSPTEIMVFGEEATSSGTGFEKVRLKLLTRIHLERISAPNQRAMLEAVWDFYRPQAIALDRTGLGLPIYQEIQATENQAFVKTVRAYSFSEKVVVGYDTSDEEADPVPIEANVLEYASDQLRLFVDTKRLQLPYDSQLIREFNGISYTIGRSNTDAYGRRHFSKAGAHAFDGCRMMITAFTLHDLEKMEDLKAVRAEPISVSFMPAMW